MASAKELFLKFNEDGEFLEFKKIEHPLSHLRDLTAFMMLAPYATGDIIGWAEHDEYGVNVDVEQLDGLPDEFIRDLVRCGVLFSEAHDCLQLFA